MEENYRFLRTTTTWKLHHLGYCSLPVFFVPTRSQFPIQLDDSKRQSHLVSQLFFRNPFTYGLLVKLAYSVCWETCEIFCVFFRVPKKKNNPKMRPSGRHQAPPAAKIHPMGAPPCHLPLPAPSLPPRPSCRNWMRQYAERVTMTIPFLPWTWKPKVALVER